VTRLPPGGPGAAGFLPPRPAERLSTPLAWGYLAAVALVWCGHVAAPVLFLVTGRSSWSTENPWVVVPALLVVASAVGTLAWVDRELHGDKPAIGQAVRMLGLAYGSAVPRVVRQLRG